MGDSLRSPFSRIAGSAAIAPVVPLHEAQFREQQPTSIDDDLEGGHELSELRYQADASSRQQREEFREREAPHFTHEYDSEGEFSEDGGEDEEGGGGGSGHGEDSTPMPRKKARPHSRSPAPDQRGHGGGGASAREHSNGSINRPSLSTSANGDAAMNGSFVERRKNVGHLLDQPDDDTADAAERLMGRESFSLDHEPLDSATAREAGHGSKGFWELPKQDRKNFLLLVLLYFLQGVPMGLATGSVPFLLKSHLSYSQIGIYSLASYPYSLKLLWSPIVDAVWNPRMGRRKSWILPIQTLSGLGMLWLGSMAQQMMEAAADHGDSGVWSFTGWWFSLVFMCATQDIAVDGWALTLISQSNLSYASTAQTVGLTAGHFLSYTVFLALSAPDFTNRYFRSTPQEYGLMTLNSYLTFWGWMYLIVTFGLAVFNREEHCKEKDGIWDVYKTMGGILRLGNIQTIILIHLIGKIGFQANDAVTNLKLLDKGFSQEDLALTVLIDFPFEIALGYYAGKWSEQYKPVPVWMFAFVGRLIAAVFAQFVVMSFPAGGTTTWYLCLVIVMHIFSTFMNTIMFVASAAFHAKIADPTIGGTYMTLLATVSNLGGTFPRFFVLKFVDLFTQATCVPPASPPADLKGELITQAFSCVAEAEKHRCIDGGGVCQINRDGYYIINIACVVFGAVTFWGFIRPAAYKLQALPLRAWRLGS